MTDPLLPGYLRNADVQQAAPGHRFSLYMHAWSREDGWTIESGSKSCAFDRVTRLGVDDRRRAEALAARQREIAGAGWVFPAELVAPWTSGLGLAHPLENGFAFLSPYGLPYLAGSGIKGVLRAAWRELAEGEFPLPRDLDPDLLGKAGELFGWAGEVSVQGTSEAYSASRGGVIALDAFPVLPDERLQLEVMTPHQAAYQRAEAPPHENEAPNPVLFLALPPGTRVEFCFLPSGFGSGALSGDDVEALLASLLSHAFDWLGFGAKTAVGYGAMRFDAQALEARREERERARSAAEREAQLSALSPLERRMTELLDARSNKEDPEFVFLLRMLDDGVFTGEEVAAVARRIRELMQAVGRWREQPGAKKKRADHERTKKVIKYLGGGE